MGQETLKIFDALQSLFQSLLLVLSMFTLGLTDILRYDLYSLSPWELQK